MKDQPTTLPKRVIDDDHRLERGAGDAQEALARHRWHWTLDETNSKRVPIREYAREVGRDFNTVAVYAKGYGRWADGGSSISRSLTDEIAVAGMGEQRRATTEALAKATGRTPTAVARGSRDEVRSTLLDAAEAAERKGTTVDEEIPRVAASRAKGNESRARSEREKRPRRGLTYIKIEGHLAAAKRRLNDALNLSGDVAFDEEERELLRDSIANLNALLNLIDMRLGGAVDVDWDAELAKLGGAS